MLRIHRLDPVDVVKIAAGEIVVSPANALKELLENSLDAGASAIDVVAAGGGLDLLQVTDNGSGIDTEDLDILCERHTTSKIRAFADVATVKTLGFRGEALASLSHVSHLKVTTRTSAVNIATTVEYEEGVPVSKKSTAGLVGTRISIENLFYNTPLRARSHIGRQRDTYARILEIVTRYALVRPQTRFSCRQKGDTHPTVIAGKDTLGRIREIYGHTIARELQSLRLEPEESMGLLSAHGYVSSINYESKRSLVTVFFVNGRLVEIPALARAISATMAAASPALASTGFVLLELELDPNSVDVNIHPTKRSVGLLYEEVLIGAICSAIDSRLASEEADSRKLRTQSFITSQLQSPTHNNGADATAPSSSLSGEDASGPESSQGSTQTVMVASIEKPRNLRPPSQRRYEHKLVRTDPKQTMLTMSRGALNSPQKRVRINHDSLPNQISTSDRLSGQTGIAPSPNGGEGILDADSGISKAVDPGSSNSQDQHDNLHDSQHSNSTNRGSSSIRASQGSQQAEYRVHNLASVSHLKQQVRQTASSRLLQLFSQSTLVGCVDKERCLAAVQSGVQLYLINYRETSRVLFYQTVLADFGNFGKVTVGASGAGLDFESLCALTGRQPSQQTLASLAGMHMMFQEYFEICLEERDGRLVLTQVPLLLPGFIFAPANLPDFCAALLELDFGDEERCFRGVAQAIVCLYDPGHADEYERGVLFNAFKQMLIPTNDLEPAVVEIANLPGLYRVFERC